MRRAFKRAGKSFRFLFGGGESEDDASRQEDNDKNSSIRSHVTDGGDSERMKGRALEILVCSWNVGNKDPRSLSPLIPPNGGGADIVAIGLQESTFGMSTDGNMHHISSLILEALGSGYTLLKSLKLMQMKLYVFVAKSLESHIRRVTNFSEATGIGGVVGNKGGLAVGFEIFSTKICFVSSHLAAHRKHTQHRNENVREITRTISSAGKMLDHRFLKKMSTTFGHTPRKSTTKKIKDDDVVANPLLNFDHIVWMGDLNYRIDPTFLSASTRASVEKDCASIASTEEALARKEKWFEESKTKDDSKKKKKIQKTFEDVLRTEWLPVHVLVRRKDWSTLLEMDQLRRAMRNGEVFLGWTSLTPSFPPTFKVLRGKETGYLHQRVSSWCDRVLYISRPHLSGYLSASSFESIQKQTSSDHKPVRATMKLLTNPPLPKAARLKEEREDAAVTTAQKKKRSSSRGSIFASVVKSLEHSLPTYYLKISKCSVNNLKPMDMDGLSDPFVEFFVLPRALCEGKKIRTPVAKNTLSTSWKEDFTIPLRIDALSDLRSATLVAQVMDEDFSKNQASGAILIPLADLFKDHTRRLTIEGRQLRKYFSPRPGRISFVADLVETQARGEHEEVRFAESTKIERCGGSA